MNRVEYEGSRRFDYGRSRSRSPSSYYGRGRSRSRSFDYGRRISRSPSLYYGRSRSRSRSRSPSYAIDLSPDSLTDDEEPISASSESWNISETAISGTLADPELLDCPICYFPLTSPVYQCTNGHISCESCCTKMSNKCGTCHLPIGGNQNRCRAIEKILESFRIACKNAQHGCMTYLTYNTKLDHDKTCRYAPCHCPHLDCTYVGLPKSVNTHFASQHSISSEQFQFDSDIYISMAKDQNHIFLQEENVKTVFVVNRTMEKYGSILNVICIAPTSSQKQFSYVIDASDLMNESKFKLECVAENSPQWNQQAPPTKHVVVPNYCLTSSGRLALNLVIFDD